jgi:hypothetical protein
MGRLVGIPCAVGKSIWVLNFLEHFDTSECRTISHVFVYLSISEKDLC